jgi:riboflavin kinase
MDEILILLLKRGAHTKPLRITTSELGTLSGMSQQNASRKLLELESEGYVERGKEGLRMTKKAYDEIAAKYSELKTVFEGTAAEISGTVVRGLGEGGYYVSMEGYRRQIREKLGFNPFPGTLNILIDKKERWRKQQLLQMEPVIIAGFRDKKRTYGDIFAYPCRIENHRCAIIIPLRTHHGPEIIEVISPQNIKRLLKKKDGERVKVVI